MDDERDAHDGALLRECKGGALLRECTLRQDIAGEDAHDFVGAPGGLGFATFAHFGKAEAVEFVDDALALRAGLRPSTPWVLPMTKMRITSRPGSVAGSMVIFRVDFYDPDHSQPEERYLTIGTSSQGRLLIVSYTERGDAIRLISARELTRSEREAYENG